MLHLETMAPATVSLARRLLALPELGNTRLVGGTALALQLGHRTSVDLDFFGEWNLRLPLAMVLSACGHVEDHGGGGRMRFFAIDDAEQQPLPAMLVPFDWEEAKDTIRAAVEEYAR